MREINGTLWHSKFFSRSDTYAGLEGVVSDWQDGLVMLQQAAELDTALGSAKAIEEGGNVAGSKTQRDAELSVSEEGPSTLDC
jgi:hypothetical protein